MTSCECKQFISCDSSSNSHRSYEFHLLSKIKKLIVTKRPTKNSVQKPKRVNAFSYLFTIWCVENVRKHTPVNNRQDKNNNNNSILLHSNRRTNICISMGSNTLLFAICVFSICLLSKLSAGDDTPNKPELNCTAVLREAAKKRVSELWCSILVDNFSVSTWFNTICACFFSWKYVFWLLFTMIRPVHFLEWFSVGSFFPSVSLMNSTWIVNVLIWLNG